MGKKTKIKIPNIENLPGELYPLIFSHCDHHQLIILELVSKSWFKLAHDSWKYLFLNYFYIFFSNELTYNSHPNRYFLDSALYSRLSPYPDLLQVVRLGQTPRLNKHYSQKKFMLVHSSIVNAALMYAPRDFKSAFKILYKSQGIWNLNNILYGVGGQSVRTLANDKFANRYTKEKFLGPFPCTKLEIQTVEFLMKNNDLRQRLLFHQSGRSANKSETVSMTIKNVKFTFLSMAALLEHDTVIIFIDLSTGKHLSCAPLLVDTDCKILNYEFQFDKHEQLKTLQQLKYSGKLSQVTHCVTYRLLVSLYNETEKTYSLKSYKVVDCVYNQESEEKYQVELLATHFTTNDSFEGRISAMTMDLQRKSIAYTCGTSLVLVNSTTNQVVVTREVFNGASIQFTEHYIIVKSGERLLVFNFNAAAFSAAAANYASLPSQDEQLQILSLKNAIDCELGPQSQFAVIGERVLHSLVYKQFHHNYVISQFNADDTSVFNAKEYNLSNNSLIAGNYMVQGVLNMYRAHPDEIAFASQPLHYQVSAYYTQPFYLTASGVCIEPTKTTTKEIEGTYVTSVLTIILPQFAIT